MRRPFGHFSLILGTAFLFGCPSDDTGSGEGTTGGPTTSTTASTSMSTSSPSTTDSSTTVEPDSSSSESGSDSGSGSGTDTGSGSGSSSDSGTAGAAGDLVINFTGYGPHTGNDVFVKVFAEDDTELGEATGVGADMFSITVPGVIEEGMNYTVRWWADLNDSGTCDADGFADHMWELSGQAGTATGLTIDHAHDMDWTDVCAFWR